MPDFHIDEDSLDRYAMGALPEVEVAQLEEHLLLCESCQVRLRQADDFAAVYRGVATAPDARPLRNWWPSLRRKVAGLAAAATMAAGILLVAVLRENTPLAPAVVSLQALRGPEGPANVPADRPAVLVFDVTRDGAPPKEARIVDLAGTEIAKGTPEWKDDRLTLTLAGLHKGQYWVRLYREGNPVPVVEYGLEAQ